MPEFFKDPTGLPPNPSLDNFIEGLGQGELPPLRVNSVLYTVVATILFVVTARDGRVPDRPAVRAWRRRACSRCSSSRCSCPPALIPQFQLILKLGLYNTPSGYILLFLVNPIGLIILVNYIRSIPRELDEAAAIDGCGYVRFVFSILLPLIRPAVATVAVLHAIGIWNELVLATIYLTNDDLYPITRGLIVFKGVYGNDWPVLAAAVLMLMLPMLVLFLFLQRYIISGLTAGAVKG